MADLFYFARINPTIDLTIFILAWILLPEGRDAGPGSYLFSLPVIQEILHEKLPSRQAWSTVLTGLTSVGTRVGGWIKSLFSASSMPVLLAKTLIGIVLLIALNEIPNTGKTIIQPFRVPSKSPPKDLLGQLISEHLLYSLGSLTQELQADFIGLKGKTGSKGKMGLKGKLEFKFVTSTGSVGSVDAAISRSPDLEFGNTKIPLSLLVSPIQVPMRKLLGVRVISGSLHTDRDGYTLLASSTTGEAWRTEPVKDLSPTGKLTSADAVAKLAEQLAFKIISTNPTLLTAMTSS